MYNSVEQHVMMSLLPRRYRIKRPSLLKRKRGLDYKNSGKGRDTRGRGEGGLNLVEILDSKSYGGHGFCIGRKGIVSMQKKS